MTCHHNTHMVQTQRQHVTPPRQHLGNASVTTHCSRAWLFKSESDSVVHNGKTQCTASCSNCIVMPVTFAHYAQSCFQIFHVKVRCRRLHSNETNLARQHYTKTRARKLGFPSSRDRVCRLVHKSAGHLAKAPTTNLAAEMMRWRRPLWSKTCQATTGGIIGRAGYGGPKTRRPRACLARPSGGSRSLAMWGGTSVGHAATARWRPNRLHTRTSRHRLR